MHLHTFFLKINWTESIATDIHERMFCYLNPKSATQTGVNAQLKLKTTGFTKLYIDFDSSQFLSYLIFLKQLISSPKQVTSMGSFISHELHELNIIIVKHSHDVMKRMPVLQYLNYFH